MVRLNRTWKLYWRATKISGVVAIIGLALMLISNAIDPRKATSNAAVKKTPVRLRITTAGELCKSRSLSWKTVIDSVKAQGSFCEDGDQHLIPSSNFNKWTGLWLIKASDSNDAYPNAIYSRARNDLREYQFPVRPNFELADPNLIIVFRER